MKYLNRIAAKFLLFGFLSIFIIQVTGAQTATSTQVEITGFAFKPARITIGVGEIITWKNLDAVSHTVTASDRSFDSGTVKNAQSYSKTFNQPGTFEYFCDPHPSMKGIIIVQPAKQAPPLKPEAAALPGPPPSTTPERSTVSIPSASPVPEPVLSSTHIPIVGTVNMKEPATSSVAITEKQPSPVPPLQQPGVNSFVGLFGTIKTAGLTALTIEAQREKEETIELELNSQTKIIIPQRQGADTAVLKPGDSDAVYALVSEGKYTALQIAAVLDEPVKKHLHGLVVDIKESRVTILDKNGKAHFLQLSDDMAAPVAGQLIMASIEEDPSLMPGASGRILIYEVPQKLLERLQKYIRKIESSEPKDEKEEQQREKDLERLEELLFKQADLNLQTIERILQTAPSEARSIYFPVLDRAIETKLDVKNQMERRKDRELFARRLRSISAVRTVEVQTSATPTPTQSPAPAATPLPATLPTWTASEVRIEISGFRFNPQTIAVPPGTTVIWNNQDPASHTVTSRDGSFESGMIRSGQSFSRTFTQVGSFDYYCEPHPTMTGTIMVQYSSQITTPLPTPIPTPIPTPAPTPPLSGNTVNISGFQFNPGTLIVNAGTTVVWNNLDPTSHTVTANDASFDSGLIRTVQSYSRVFTQTGTFGYHCDPHPTMTGTIIVMATTLMPSPTPIPTPVPSTPPSPTPVPLPAPVIPPGGANVDISGFAFNPQSITVTVGTSVTWKNLDPVSHTVTANDGSSDSGLIRTGQTYNRVFTQVGTFSYHCDPHPNMTGTVIVQAATPNPSLPGPTPIPTPTPPPSSSQVNIAIGSNTYSPAVVTVGVGTTITWKNFDPVRHTVTALNKKLFDSNDLQIGQSYTRTFNQAGIFDYFCDRHKSMNARVIVQAAAPAAVTQSGGEAPVLSSVSLPSSLPTSVPAATPSPAPASQPAQPTSPSPAPTPVPMPRPSQTPTPAPTPQPTQQ